MAKYEMAHPLIWLGSNPPTKNAWKNYCKNRVMQISNNMMKSELFKGDYYKYVQPSDFSFSRKELPPILYKAETSKQMKALRLNIRLLANEFPLLSILKRKTLIEDDICKFCNAASQTHAHLIDSCVQTAKTVKAMELKNEIIEFVLNNTELCHGCTIAIL